MLSLTIVAILGSLPAVLARGEWLYSVDHTNNTLIRINGQTGEVVPVVNLSVPVMAPVAALRLHQGSLYALRYDFGVETRLIGIAPLTGTVFSDIEVTVSGSSVEFAEGLVSTGDGLLIGFHTSVSGPFDSDAIGDLALDGAITNATSLASNADLDEIAHDPLTGNIYNIDGVFQVTSNLYLVEIAPASYVFQGSVFGGAYVPVDTDMSDGELVGITGTTLYRIDPVTRATLATIPLSVPGDYRGLSRTERDWNCAADFDGSGAVDGADLGLLLGLWGGCGVCVPDFNGDGFVDGADLGLLLGAWGACP
ncbi:MAG: hypothetical protein ACF8GE_07855 [Phycisphaerales bacterium JB043]